MNTVATESNPNLQRARNRLIQSLIDQGITNERVLEALRVVPRHLFIEPALQYRAYEDATLPIGQSQTISQPYIVALMTQALFASSRVQTILEVGTGCGYQTAVLGALVKRVYTVERIRSLQESAEARLRDIGYRNIEYRHGDGFVGWKDRAPYDGIIITAAANEIPKMLLEQLAIGGRMVLPLEEKNGDQYLRVIRKTGKDLVEENLLPVRFVPLLRGVQA
ncbi:MAG: protein-L-isoaspartate(D-aspartate) O-methyltransferase [Pseudomonadales bacterium]|nr:protein-L-isoaspartate(D-aspartate) O-methyltransferase [Pseudomonadales bacterium]